jgi:hypothetical protein
VVERTPLHRLLQQTKDEELDVQGTISRGTQPYSVACTALKSIADDAVRAGASTDGSGCNIHFHHCGAHRRRKQQAQDPAEAPQLDL